MAPDIPPETIVAFDLDGTLIRGDSLIPFLAYAFGPTRVALSLGRATRIAARSRLSMKTIVFDSLFRGEDVERVRDAAKRFAARLVGPPVLRRGIVEIAHRIQEQHTVGIVTASPQLYGSYFAEYLGLEFCLGTRLESMNGVFTGSLVEANCRGIEKVRRIEEAFPHAVLVAAFGDSTGDQEMLTAAGLGYQVRRWWDPRITCRRHC